jgi:hypothetical protein
MMVAEKNAQLVDDPFYRAFIVAVRPLPIERARDRKFADSPLEGMDSNFRFRVPCKGLKVIVAGFGACRRRSIICG